MGSPQSPHWIGSIPLDLPIGCRLPYGDGVGSAAVGDVEGALNTSGR